MILKNKKLLLLFGSVIFCFILINNIFAISILDTKDISKDYFFNDEYIDNNTKIVSCENETYFVVPALNSNGSVTFFVPINNSSGQIYSEDDDVLKSLFKTTYFLKKITTSNSNNYLSLQLVDKINQLILILNSKNSQLQGIINNDYSLEITNTCKSSQSELNNLLENLETLKVNLENAYRKQEEFTNNSDCLKTDKLILIFKNAFEGYSDITEFALNFQNSTNLITEKVVANNELDQITKNMIINYASSPLSLSSEISTIYDSLSKTNSFYNPIVNSLLKTGDNNPINLQVHNFLARSDLVKVNAILYGFDAELNGSVDEVSKYVLSSELNELWVDQESVKRVKTSYLEVTKLYEDKDYSLIINKVNYLKLQLKKVIKSGSEIKESENNFDFETKHYLITGIAIVLILLLIYLINKNKKKKRYTKVVNNNKKDPFN